LTTPAPTLLLTTYLEKREMLVRLFSASLRDPVLAEDVIQDLYLKIARVDPTYEIDNPTAFLFRMANNIYLNRLRARKSADTREQAWHDTHSQMSGGEAIDEAPSAETQLQARQQLERLLENLKDLPEKTQTIFRLHKLEGVPQTEVAARLGISISSVEKQLSAALKSLMTRLRAESGP
jgi:RNA polymerase sigma factor (sigma-70 family)